MKKTSLCFGLLLAAAGALSAQTPTWDTSGNGQLKGAYYFREVIYVVADQAGDLSRAFSLYGQLTFDGNGNYSISNANILDSNAGQIQTFSASGTYSIASSGYGFLTHPLSNLTTQYTLFGLVSNGTLISSATDSQFNDLFIATPVASFNAGSFRGSYSLAGFFPAGSPDQAADTLFQLNPDGNGNLGTVGIAGYFGGGGSTRYTQSTPSVKYIASNNAFNIAFPNSTTANFYSGNEYLYMSPDGNFVFGGSPNGYDMFLGVKNDSNVNFGGLYYEAGLDLNAAPLSTQGYALVDTFYGSLVAAGGNILGHQRVYTPVVNTQPEGLTYSATYPPTISNGTYTTTAGDTQYLFGNGGAVRIGFGIGPTLGINVALKAPTLSGDGVYLNPQGITNAASFSPFTAGISAGEFLVLYGTNLATGFQVASGLPFPTKLNGVQVTVNGLPAPIYYVSATQLSIIVPYGVPGPIAQIQVTNNGAASNVVTQFVNLTTPGLFTLAANGLGRGAVEHADGSVVTPDNPAKPGETVAMFVSGLGTVSPPNAEGAAGPVSPLSYTSNTLLVYVGGQTAKVQYSGLAPYLAGLYQLNVTIPATATTGDNTVEIFGPDSDAFQATIPVSQ